MAKDFKPPRQTESHAVVFDRMTGEILAIHTRWVDAGAKSGREAISRELLESIARDADRAVEELDVLPTRPRQGFASVRVDPKTRRLQVQRASRKTSIGRPDVLRRP